MAYDSQGDLAWWEGGVAIFCALWSSLALPSSHLCHVHITAPVHMPYCPTTDVTATDSSAAHAGSCMHTLYWCGYSSVAASRATAVVAGYMCTLSLPLLSLYTYAPSHCCCRWMHACHPTAADTAPAATLLLLLLLPLCMCMTFCWPLVHVCHLALVSPLSVCSTLPVKA